MPFIVIHEDTENIAHYCRFDDVNSAALYLEELHNEGGISDARLFTLDEVEFAVKSYVKVEIADLAPDASLSPSAPVAVAVEAVMRAEAAEAGVVAEDDAVAYVEAATLIHDGPVPPLESEPTGERVGASEVRRGLFGR